MSCRCGHKGTKANPLIRKYGTTQCKECLEAQEKLARRSAKQFTQKNETKRTTE